MKTISIISRIKIILPISIFFTIGLLSIAVFASNPAPGGVNADLQLWLKADSGVVGSPGVIQWSDQSGDSNDATAAGDPQIGGTLINFNPTIDLDGTDDGFLLPDSTLTGVSNDYSYIAVGFTTNSDTQQTVIGTDVAGASTGVQARVGGSGGQLVHNWISRGFNSGSSNPISSNVPWLAAYTYDSSGSGGVGRRIIHAGAEITNDPDTSYTPVSTLQRVGVSGGTGNFPYHGALAEIIAYDRHLFGADLLKIHSYLAIKYGLTLDQTTPTSYLSSLGSEVYDADGDYSLYAQGVAGIARDDDTELDQRISRSADAGTVVTISTNADFTSENTENRPALDNNQYLVWGHDDGTISFVTTNVPSGYNSRIEREWRVSITGGTHEVFISFDNLPQMGQYTLLRDADGDFTFGAEALGLQQITSGESAIFNTAALADGDYLALAFNPDLHTSAIDACFVFTEDYAPGESGEEMLTVQEYLIHEGYRLSLSGVNDVETTNVISRFQVDNSISVPDGTQLEDDVDYRGWWIATTREFATNDLCS